MKSNFFEINLKKYGLIHHFLLFAGFFITVVVCLFIFQGNSSAYQPMRDVDADWLLRDQCETTRANNTLHIVYIDSTSLTQYNDSITFYFKAKSLRCRFASPATATLVYNQLTGFSGPGSNTVVPPITFYQGETIALDTIKTGGPAGPYTVSGMGAGWNYFTYSYAVGSFGTSNNTGSGGLELLVNDLCANIGGIQYPTIPYGLSQSGTTCYFQDPTCSGWSAITVNVNSSFTSTIRAWNNSAGTLDVTSVSYSGPGGISGSANPADIAQGGAVDYSSSARSIATAVSGSIVWQVNFIRAFFGTVGSISCTQPITVLAPIDLCLNITGSQTSVPVDHYRDGAGNCYPLDVCNNIASAQPSIPFGLVSNGAGGCVYTNPTCIAIPTAAISTNTGVLFTTSINLRNNSVATLDINGITYSGPGPISGTPNNGSVDIGPSPAHQNFSGNHTLNNPTAGTITWTISFNRPSSLGLASIQCGQSLTVTNRPPSCTVLSMNPVSPQVNQAFAVRVSVRNPNPTTMTMTTLSYSLKNSGGTNLDPTFGNSYFNGNSTGVFPRILPAGNVPSDFTSNQNIQVFRQVLDFNVVWTVVTTAGGISSSITCQQPAASLFDIPLLPPTCFISPDVVSMNTPFSVKVTVENPNVYASLRLLDNTNNPGLGSPDFSMSNGQSGQAIPPGGWTGLPAGYVMAPGTAGSTIITSIPPLLTATTEGSIFVYWFIESEAGPAGGHCNTLTPPPAILVVSQPYSRFYGADVIAGGGFVCVTSPNLATVKSMGNYTAPTPQNHSTYIGAASELAVLATGQIEGVLPGSQLTSRAVLAELAMANNVGAPNGEVNANSKKFGGGLSAVPCASSFPTTNTTTLAPGILSDLTTGITLGAITNATRRTYVVTGDVRINGDIAYANTSWLNVSDIPLFRIYVTGNIFISGNVKRLDGIYSATGTIYTCAPPGIGQAPYNVSTDGLAITTNCNENLTVNGAFAAQDVKLMRIKGTVGGSTAGENFNSANIAEVFRFTPEHYLALLSASPNTANKFDSIESLPPAY